jgi:hypothetical protein
MFNVHDTITMWIQYTVYARSWPCARLRHKILVQCEPCNYDIRKIPFINSNTFSVIFIGQSSILTILTRTSNMRVELVLLQGSTLAKIWARHSGNLGVDLRLPESISGCPNKNAFIFQFLKKEILHIHF